MKDIGQPLRVAFVGAGGMIREHAKAFADIPGIELAGIWNRSRVKAEALAAELGITRVFDSIAAMQAETRADLVVMAVYETAILQIATELAAFPWTILMEKPVGLDFAEAERIGKIMEGKQVYVGLNRRALGSSLAVQNDLQQQTGSRYIHVCDQQSLQTAAAIGHDPAVIRNWMYANSIHLVDYLCAFGRGDIVEVRRLNRWNPENPGLVLAHVRFSSGDTGLYEGIWNGPGPWACYISTPGRRWELRPLEKAVFQNAGERSLNDVNADPWDSAFKPGFRRQAGWVVDAMRGQSSPAVTLAEAMRATRLVREIFEV